MCVRKGAVTAYGGVTPLIAEVPFWVVTTSTCAAYPHHPHLNRGVPDQPDDLRVRILSLSHGDELPEVGHHAPPVGHDGDVGFLCSFVGTVSNVTTANTGMVDAVSSIHSPFPPIDSYRVG